MPIITRPHGPIHSLSNAYLRKNPTPRATAMMPIRLNQFPPMRASRSARAFVRVEKTGGGTVGAGRSAQAHSTRDQPVQARQAFHCVWRPYRRLALRLCFGRALNSSYWFRITRRLSSGLPPGALRDWIRSRTDAFFTLCLQSGCGRLNLMRETQPVLDCIKARGLLAQQGFKLIYALD